MTETLTHTQHFSTLFRIIFLNSSNVLPRDQNFPVGPRYFVPIPEEMFL